MIDRDLYESYARALGTNADMAQRALSGVMDLGLSGLSGADLSDALSDAMVALVRTYGPRAATVAVELYRAQREASGVASAYEATASTSVDDAAIRAATMAEASLHQSRDGLSKALSGQLVRHVNSMADDTLTDNARRDPAHPRWALVPHVGACGWCLMIASRGFDYARKDRVPRHNSCRCTAVVDFDRESPSLEGYDVDALRDRYSLARSSVEADAQGEWDAMDEGQRRSYRRKGRGAYDVYLRNRIAGAMGHLD